MKKYKTLIICIAIPLVIGGLSALLTMGNMDVYDQINKPLLSPPGWIFPIVWTVLFILMGVASYKVLISNKNQDDVINALTFYAIQLAINFFWPLFFFNGNWFFFSFLWLILLWIFILKTIQLFWNIEKNSAKLLLPYLIWVTFAGYLNFAIYLLN